MPAKNSSGAQAQDSDADDLQSLGREWIPLLSREKRSIETDTWGYLSQLGEMFESEDPSKPDQRPRLFSVMSAFAEISEEEVIEVVGDARKSFQEGDLQSASKGMSLAAIAFGVLALRESKAKRKKIAWTFSIDGWRCFDMALQFALLRGGSTFALKGSDARHSENRAMKKQAIDYYTANIARFTSKDAAAEEISRTILPVKFRTVRDWLSQLRSTGTP